MKNFRLLFVSAAASLLLLASCKKDNSVEIRNANFEKLTLGTTGYWNGADGSGTFQCEDMTFTNSYNVSYSSWSGFAYSQKNDVTTASFNNQYSVYDASNANNKFAIFYPPFDAEVYASFPTNTEYSVKSISLCNSTYVALSMKNGDSYAKKFGGTSGNDADWFKVTIKGFDASGTSTGSTDFYLADYRSSDNTKDYIVNKWTEIDLTLLGKVNKLTFLFTSSDNGAWGMNTPAYICIDNIKYESNAEGM